MMEKDNGDSEKALALKSAIEQRIRKLEEKRPQVIDPSNKESRIFLIEIAGVLAEFYDNYGNYFEYEDFEKLDNDTSGLLSSSDRLSTSFKEWHSKRKELIETLDSSARELDNRFTVVTLSRLAGSILDLIYNADSIFDNAISKSVTEQAFKISRGFGIASMIFFKCLPHFAYMGLVAAFGDISWSRLTMREVLKINQEDTELFARVEKWFQETDDLNYQINQRFPVGLDANVAKMIENGLSEYDDNTKVFVTALFSSLKTNPLGANKIEHLLKLFTFSKTDAAKEWYNRSLVGTDPIGFEITKLEYRNQLLQLALSSPDIPVEIMKLVPEIEIKSSDTDTKAASKDVIKINLKFVPHLCLGAINCIYIYSSVQQLRDRIKHKHSDLLRDMSTKANFHRKTVNSFMNNYIVSRKQLGEGITERKTSS